LSIGLAAAIRRLDLAPAAVPVNPRDLPAAAGEEEQAWSIDALGEEHGVTAPDFLAPREHGELRRGGEDCGHAREMAMAEVGLGVGANEEELAICVHEAVLHEVGHDGCSAGIERLQAVPLRRPLAG
jgi:hypothetical protein